MTAVHRPSANRPPSAGTRPIRRAIGLLLFDGVEVLDFAGPYEVFSASRDEDGVPQCEVVTMASRPQVQCYGGLRVIPDVQLDQTPPLDVLVVPGGPGAREHSPEHDFIIPFIREQSRRAELVASVCTGAFLLGRAGLLDGRSATTHQGRMDMFRAEFPQVDAVQAKVVDQGAVITAGGISSGIDLALYLLERWFGPAARQREARRLEGPWR